MKLFLTALFFSFLLCGLSLHEFIATDGTSTRLFNDSDESFYLRAVLDNGKLRSHAALYFEHSEPVPLKTLLFSWRPDQGITHVVIGAIANYFNLGVTSLGLLFDFILAFSCYLIVFKLFSLFDSNSNSAVSIATICFLAFPWFLSLEQYLPFDISISNNLVSLDILSHVCLPVLEGLETQLGVLGSVLVYYFLARAYQSDFQNKKLLFCLGVSLGALIYIYVLAWIAVFGIVASFFAFIVLLKIRESAGRIGRVLVSFISVIGTSMLTSLVGILQIQALRSDDKSFVDSKAIYQQVGYFSSLSMLMLIALLFILARVRGKNRFFVILTISILIAEFLLGNLQAFTGVATQAVFIFAYFTRPLLNASFLFLIITLFSQERIISLSLKFLSVFLLLSIPVTQYRAKLSGSPMLEFNELIRFVENTIPKKSVILMSPFDPVLGEGVREWDYRAHPNKLAALTGTFTFKEVWGLEHGGIPHAESIKRELAMGFMLSGNPRLLRPCEFEPVLFPRTLFFQPWVPVQLNRLHTCRKNKDILVNYNSCDAVKDFKMDYLVWESKLGLDFPSVVGKSLRKMWESSRSSYELYEIDREMLIDELCR